MQQKLYCLLTLEKHEYYNFGMGSDGDVNPFIALGLGLQKAGHTVQLATSFDYKEKVAKWGLGYIPVDEGIELSHSEYLDKDGTTYIPNTGQNPFMFAELSKQGLQSIEDTYLSTLHDICQGAEALIFTVSSYQAYELVEKLGVPAYAAPLVPIHQTQAFPCYMTPSNIRLGGIYNWLTYPFFYLLLWQYIRKPINQWRQEILDLPPVSLFSDPLSRMNKQKLPFLGGYSPAFLPKPSDWPDWVHVTGYWFLDSPKDWQPPQELMEFIAAGSPPVYIGFGNRGADEPEELKGAWEPKALTQLLLQALKISGQRGILLIGDDISNQVDLPDEVFPIEWVPFDWLFSQMAAVVHHGGCGTVHAGLRAGVPNIIVPYHYENFFWAYRIAELSIGPQPIQREQISAERLAAAIQTATSDKTMQARATAMGKRIQAEDGVQQAVEVFHKYLPT